MWHVNVYLCQYHLLKRLFIPNWMILALLLKTNWPKVWKFISGHSILIHSSTVYLKYKASRFFFLILIWLFFIPCITIKFLHQLVKFCKRANLGLIGIFEHYVLCDISRNLRCPAETNMLGWIIDGCWLH